MKILIYISVMCLLVACVSESKIKISDQRTGLVEILNAEFRMYEYSEIVTYEENSTCIIEGERIGCIRFGLEFNWSAVEVETHLECKTYITTEIQKYDSSKGEMMNKTNTVDSSLILTGSVGTYLLPRVYFNYGHKEYRSTDFIMSCFHEGRKVFTNTQTLVENPDKFLENDA